MFHSRLTRLRREICVGDFAALAVDATRTSSNDAGGCCKASTILILSSGGRFERDAFELGGREGRA